MKKQILTALITLVLTGYPAAITNSILHSVPSEGKGGIAVVKADEPAAFCKVKLVWVTAYSSTPEETDSTPFVTANNTMVRDGIIATNLLPFGTQIQIPAVFGDRVFTVEDRMHYRKQNFVDVWMPEKNQAVSFGIRKTEIVILD